MIVAIPRVLLGSTGIFLCLLTGCSSGFRQRSAAELLSDSRYAWITDSTTHTRVHYLARTPAADSIARLKRDLEASWTTAAEFIGGTPIDRAIDVFAVPTREMVGEVAGLNVQTNALNFWDQRVIVAWVTARATLGPHEFVHIMAHDAWGSAPEWWLGEGVAVASGRWNGVDVHAYAKCLSNTGKLVPLGTIVPGLRNPDDQTARVAYPEAGSFVRFLIERYGRGKVSAMYPKGVVALPATFGRSLSELEAEWRRHLTSVESDARSCAVS